MIASMTGYGRAEGVVRGKRIIVELKSLNHRFLEIVLRLPPSLSYWEYEIRKKLAGAFSRGRIEVTVWMDNLSDGGDLETLPSVNIQLARRYLELLKLLKTELSLGGEVDVSLIALFKDIFVTPGHMCSSMFEWNDLEGIFQSAICALKEMRIREGESLKEDLIGRVNQVSEYLDFIEERSPWVVREYRERLIDRIRELLDAKDVDENRIYQEVAFFAERCDVTEEIVRLRSHIDQFHKLLADGGVIGRKIDFLLQEMNREINTVGSKSNDITITKYVIDVKNEIAKIREQAQNIE
ncbi:MAG: YicC family protein [Syntrophales bacterium]|nr:YicC family protein [Syntrophales bacterium]